MATATLKDEDISFLSRLVERAGKVAVEMRAGVTAQEKSGPEDLVTEADRFISEMILAEMAERFPGDLLISEEAEPDVAALKDRSGRTWFIDPIDGTDNYLDNDGQYSVMVGLMVGGEPVFGFVFAPSSRMLYLGGPGFGTWQQTEDGVLARLSPDFVGPIAIPARVMMGSRDKKRHPWVLELPDIDWVSSGSIGLKVAKVLLDEADLYVSLSGKLKLWDTVAPCALALGSGLEVGCLESAALNFPRAGICHETSVIIGRDGAVSWSRARFGNRITV